MTQFTRVTDGIDDVLAAYHNELIDGLQQLPGPAGFLINGKIVVTVASNNLTVAIKTLAGANPSLLDPVAVRINNTVRLITAALSVTKAAGTNWCNLGGAELATNEVDLFPYLVWNTNLATPAVDIFWSRIPYGSLYSDFSGTTTNEKYAAINGTAPASTDECVNIGRFAATLSAGAAYTWSVPTFTNANLVQRPTEATRLLNWTPTLVGWSSAPTNTVYQYMIRGEYAEVWVRQGTANTSNATGTTLSAPISCSALTNGTWSNNARVNDNGSTQATAGIAQIRAANPATLEFGKDFSTVAGWTASGNKAILSSYLKYPIR